MACSWLPQTCISETLRPARSVARCSAVASAFAGRGGGGGGGGAGGGGRRLAGGGGGGVQWGVASPGRPGAGDGGAQRGGAAGGRACGRKEGVEARECGVNGKGTGRKPTLML